MFMFRQPYRMSELDRLRQDFERLFDSSVPRIYRQSVRSFPAVNIWTSDKEGVVVTAELPGVDADDVNISVTGDTLTISGTRQPVEGTASEQYHRREQSYGDFNRVVQLPFTVNNEAVEASADKGILRIYLPRAEAEKPRQIAVKAGS